MGAEWKYVSVIVPLKFGEPLSYRAGTSPDLVEGCWVMVPVGAHEYMGVVVSISDDAPEIGISKVKDISSLLSLPPVSPREIRFWKALADYYMCSIGEVFKAVCPLSFRRQVKVKPRKKSSAAKSAETALPVLSQAQRAAATALRKHFSGSDLVQDAPHGRQPIPAKRPAFLYGVTGSGKTAVYMDLAMETLGKGGSVLYLVPEIAISKQLKDRLSSVFADRLLVFHSKLSAPGRMTVFNAVTSGEDAGPHIVLGTRSALFLPIRNLKLVIIDEEHDTSYKQNEPSPRYNGRDAALLKAAVFGADALLGSATPSFETMYNVATGRFFRAELLEKYNGAPESSVKIIDTVKARRLHSMKGSFAIEALNEMRRCVESGLQVLVFRSRRAYSSAVQCSECGYVPLCPECNIPLSYHKFKDALMCHYCGRSTAFSQSCPKCGAEEGMALHGSGTEKLEEELKEYFPEFRVARFDADTAESGRREDSILKDFAEGGIDILVGTQMITKGFDFDALSLVVVVAADSLLAVQDFRADERALQTLRQFRGRAGRRKTSGRMLVQTCQSSHPVFARLLADGSSSRVSSCDELLSERRAFLYPPFVRMISITVRDRSEGRLWHVCRDIRAILDGLKIDSSGPVEPAVEFFRGMHSRQFWIKLPRNRALVSTKATLHSELDAMLKRYRNAPALIVDVDPM